MLQVHGLLRRSLLAAELATDAADIMLLTEAAHLAHEGDGCGVHRGTRLERPTLCRRHRRTWSVCNLAQATAGGS